MMRFLVMESEGEDEREARRAHAGRSSGESYQATLVQLVPTAAVERVAPADPDEPAMTVDDLARFDAVFLTGSPLHVYQPTPAVRRQLAFMEAVFASGVPSFGSCAGLQLAVAAAGGTVRAMPQRMEAAISRRITRTATGEGHPLLAGRPGAWDAPAIHGDEVDRLPAGALCLATNGVTAVQAVEIRHAGGVFWGVQYHPELSSEEIAIALRRQAGELVEAGLADDEEQVGQRAALLDRLQADPADRAVRWQLGVDGQFADEAGRRRELINFIAAIPHLRAPIAAGEPAMAD